MRSLPSLRRQASRIGSRLCGENCDRDQSDRPKHLLQHSSVAGGSGTGSWTAAFWFPRSDSEEGTMRYEIPIPRLLPDSVVREIIADGRSAGTALVRGASVVWPPHAMRVRILRELKGARFRFEI